MDARAMREQIASQSPNPKAAWAQAFLQQANVRPELVADYVQVFVDNSVDEQSVALFEKPDLLGIGIRIGDTLKVIAHAKATAPGGTGGRGAAAAQRSNHNGLQYTQVPGIGLSQQSGAQFTPRRASRPFKSALDHELDEEQLSTAQEIANAKHKLRSMKPQLGFGFGDLNPLTIKQAEQKCALEGITCGPIRGVKVSTVQPDHSADAAGLEVNDVVTAFGGVPLKNKRSFLSAFRRLGIRPGDRLPLKVVRGGVMSGGEGSGTELELMMVVGSPGMTLKDVIKLRATADAQTQQHKQQARVSGGASNAGDNDGASPTAAAAAAAAATTPAAAAEDMFHV